MITAKRSRRPRRTPGGRRRYSVGDWCTFGLDGFEVLAAADSGGELELLIQTTADLVGYPGADRWSGPKTAVRPGSGICRSVVLCWVKRVWSCRHELCEVKTWTPPTKAGPEPRRSSPLRCPAPSRSRPSGQHAARMAHQAARLLRHRRRLKRPHRSDQPTDRDHPLRRTRIPQLRQLQITVNPCPRRHNLRS